MNVPCRQKDVRITRADKRKTVVFAANIKRMQRKGKKIIKNLSKETGSLEEKTARGGLWVIMLQISSRMLQFIKTIVLARILFPEDFGLFGMALLSFSIIETLTQLGFNHAIIQKKKDSEKYINTAWSLQVIKGVVMCIALFVLAPVIGRYFSSEEVVPLIRVIGFSGLIQGFENTYVVYFEKELKFNKFFAYRSLGYVLDTVASISLAIILKNAWAMVFGLLVGHAFRVAISLVVVKRKPKFNIDLGLVKELWDYGKWLVVSSIFNFIITDADDIFVRKFFGDATLGSYQLAYNVSNSPATEVTRVVSKVMFPVFSKIQDKEKKLQDMFSATFQVISFLAIPLAFGIYIFANDFTLIVLKDKWIDVIPLMQVLVWWGVIRSLAESTNSIFLAIGKPKIISISQIVQSIIMYSLFFPFTLNYGVIGAAFSVLAASVLMFFIQTGLVINALKIKPMKIYIHAILASICSGFACIIPAVIQNNLNSERNILLLVLQFLSFIVVYLLSVVLIEKIFGYELIGRIKRILFKALKG